MREQEREKTLKEAESRFASSLENVKKRARQEEIVELIRIYLVARFAKAPEEVLEVLRKVEDIQQLENLASRIYQCQNFEDMAKLLA